LAVISEIVATFAAGIFAGASLYINLVEQPARLSCGTELAVTEWRPSYSRGTKMQAPLALVGSVAALAGWWLGAGVAWLVGGLFLASIILFTVALILPTNRRLQSQTLDLRSEEAGRLLRLWGRLHAVRSVLSGAAFLLFLFRIIAPH
jgi:hypothetical protein